MAEMLGYRPEEVLGRRVESFIFPEDLTDYTSKMTNRQKGIIEQYERRYKRKDGGTLWVLISPKPLFDVEEGFDGSFSMITNITQRKEMEESLRASEEKYRALFEQMGAGLIIVEEDTTISLANNEFAKLTGYLKEEIEGKKKSSDFIMPEDVEWIHHNHHSRRKNSHASPNEYESRIVDKYGKVKYVLNTVTMIPGTTKSIVSFSDITERKKAEEALLEKQAQLQAMTLRMSNVEESERKEISRILHDLVGQSLTALNLNLNIAASLLPQKTGNIIVQRLQEAMRLGEEVTRYIREVMSDLRPSVLDDFGLISALHWYGERFRGLTGLRIYFKEKGSFPRLPSTMETIIFRIVQEALVNVSKHAGADRVTIVVEKKSGMAQITITDTGLGFHFKGFRDGGERRGWGLATMKERAESLGGDLQIRSGPGIGTRLTLRLPID